MKKTRKNRFKAPVVAMIALGFASSSAWAGGFLDAKFADATFLINPLMISNPYWPLNPGGGTSTPLTFTYEAETEDECVLNTLFIILCLVAPGYLWYDFYRHYTVNLKRSWIAIFYAAAAAFAAGRELQKCRAAMWRYLRPRLGFS